ncbi:hypothetical protein [Streptomyces sp. NPDC059009]|uniref:hypothetical protein n=1 Tax=Streptomyces sp. NPDC059009 TaxID=3346694 RepID=UPI0036809409
MTVRSRRARTGLWCVTAVMGAALMSGCSEDSPPPAIKFRAAKPAGDKLGFRPTPGSPVTLSQWPDACKLMTDGEIRAILPQAKEFERKPVKVTILNMDPLSEAAPGTTGDVPRGGCEFGFALPSKGGDSSRNSSVSITVTAIADPAAVKKRYLEDKKGDSKKKGFTDLGDSWGVEGCYAVQNSVSDTGADCYQGPYLFEVGGSSWADGVAPQPGADAEPAENIAAVKKRARTWQTKVLAESVRTVGARMS